MEFEQLPPNLFRFGFNKSKYQGLPLLREDVERVANWVAPRFEKSKKLCKTVSSYGIKHIVERAMGEYVGNGELIAAMILCGFKYEQDGMNAYFFIDPKSIKE